ncbi:MAG: hypothetical protein GWP61_24485 [Chloroflexi bacterium]|nr:hypothetical protein [Chloroflexota bacterium]
MSLASSLENSWFAALMIFQARSVPIWVPLLIILLIILLFWWGLTRNRIPDETKDVVEELEEDEPELVVAETPPADFAEAELASAIEEPISLPEPDDLKLIEGIGPKIAGILADEGITTFAQVADTDTAALEKIVREDAGIKTANTTSWPQQAALAAAGDWDGLEALQRKLVAGRHRE